MQKIEPNGGGKSAVATRDGRIWRKKEKTDHWQFVVVRSV